MPLARKPSLKFGQKPRNDWSANAATVECALPIRTASNGISARPINKMDDDTVQAALATVCVTMPAVNTTTSDTGPLVWAQ